MPIRFVARAALSARPSADFIEWDAVFATDVSISFGTQPFLPGLTNAGKGFKITHPADLVVRTQGSGASDWNGDFVNGDKVLFTDLEPGPIVLFFDKPVRGIGANVQANVLTNQKYSVRMKVFLVSGAGQAFTRPATMQNLGTGLAPFLGALSDNADIVRAEFHVTLPLGNGSQTDLDIAINRVELA